jgi:hypothetical protein
MPVAIEVQEGIDNKKRIFSSTRKTTLTLSTRIGPVFATEAPYEPMNSSDKTTLYFKMPGDDKWSDKYEKSPIIVKRRYLDDQGELTIFVVGANTGKEIESLGRLY